MKIFDYSRYIFYNIALLLLVSLLTVTAGGTSVDSLFRSDKLLIIELRSDFSAIQKERRREPGYHPGELIYYTGDGSKTSLSVKLMARGRFRLDPSNCKFPPLFIDFRKSEVKNTLFDNQNKLKLVTPCQLEKYVIDEYTVYKLYNQVTDLSMQVRLAKILYFDTGRNRKLFERYSFFIEDKDHVARRNGLIAKDRVVTPFDLDKDNYQKLAFFQYFIGNLDWYISSRKNIVLMQSVDHGKSMYAVPFDFDFSEIVDAYYAKPAASLSDSLKKRRVYRGLCYTEEELHNVFEFYEGLRPSFESVIRDQPLLTAYNKNRLLRYMNGFYTVFDSKELIQKEFFNACETMKDYMLDEK